MAMLILLPMFTIAQTENKTTYIVNIGHNNNCRGGFGICRESEIIGSKETTTTSVSKISENQLEVTLEKTSFTSKEWEEMLTNKVFPIDDDSITIDEELLRTLKIEAKYNTIKPNNYSVIVKNEKAIFTLELLGR